MTPEDRAEKIGGMALLWYSEKISGREFKDAVSAQIREAVEEAFKLHSNHERWRCALCKKEGQAEAYEKAAKIAESFLWTQKCESMEDRLKVLADAIRGRKDEVCK